MEYFLGSIFTLIAVYVIAAVIRRSRKEYSSLRIKYSQSQIHELMVDIAPLEVVFSVTKITQSSKHYNQMFTYIVVAEDKAYWITEGIFYEADVMEDGSVSRDSARQVDTMSMNKVELEKIMFIVEELAKGNNNDNWNSG
jgi:hypothetical protein